MKICLIDADSTIPNIPLMKLSTYYKGLDCDVQLFRANIPFFPTRRKKEIFYAPEGFDLTYASVIFQGNKEYVVGDGIIFGGTGIDLTTNLPPWIDECEPDYSIYPDNDTSYGFLSRGCKRKCPFCVVPQKEGGIRQVATVDDIVRHDKVKFLDNNFLALPNHKEILQELLDKDLRFQFNQGLDIRLLDEENSELFSKARYYGDFIFAFDDWKMRNLIQRGLDLLYWRKPFKVKFFVYIHPDMPLSDTINRVEFLKERKALPYIMRDLSCWDAPYRDFYIDYASYGNQPHLFRKMSFAEFLEIRYKNRTRIKESLAVYEEHKNRDS